MARAYSRPGRSIFLKQVELSLTRLSGTLEGMGAPPDPIIVLGMHRSGTTMLVDVLQRTGVFMGSRLSGNREPRIFQDANRQIFDYFGASWLDGDLLPKPNILRECYSGLASMIADRLSDDLRTTFFDVALPVCQHWGFKDPRNSITAGLFLRLFPRARAIFIHRDPLDVALSIVTRERKQKRKYPGMGTFEFSLDAFQSLMMRSVAAWETYNERAMDVLPMFGSYSILRYESVIAAPVNILTPALAALGLSISREAIDSVGIRPERAHSATKLDVDLSQLRSFLAKSKVAIRLSEDFAAT